jgi:hypothetical protein
MVDTKAPFLENKGWGLDLSGLNCRASSCFETGHDIRTVQEFLGQKDLETTMIYTHVHNRGAAGVRSPVNGRLVLVGGF